IDEKNSITQNQNKCSVQDKCTNSRTKPISKHLIFRNLTLFGQSVLAYQIPLETNTNSTNLEE
ncbi:MAG: hypothetical protein ACXADB_10720, partial [Candidatus Hermodarchaeia archaeon]